MPAAGDDAGADAGCAGVRAEQLIDVDIRRIDGAGGLRCRTAHARRGAIGEISRHRAQSACAQKRCEGPGDKAVCGIAKENFVGVNAHPFGPQSSGEIAADGRRHHGDDHQIYSGAGFECRCRNAAVAPGRYGRQAKPRSECDQKKRQVPPRQQRPRRSHPMTRQTVRPRSWTQHADRFPFIFSRRDVTSRLIIRHNQESSGR